MGKELEFFMRVGRNGLILSGLYFISIYASTEILTYASIKPVVIFLGTYVLTELAARYGLNKQQIKPLNKRGSMTLLF
jgi:hypothetical protein